MYAETQRQAATSKYTVGDTIAFEMGGVSIALQWWRSPASSEVWEKISEITTSDDRCGHQDDGHRGSSLRDIISQPGRRLPPMLLPETNHVGRAFGTLWPKRHARGPRLQPLSRAIDACAHRLVMWYHSDWRLCSCDPPTLTAWGWRTTSVPFFWSGYGSLSHLKRRRGRSLPRMQRSNRIESRGFIGSPWDTYGSVDRGCGEGSQSHCVPLSNIHTLGIDEDDTAWRRQSQWRSLYKCTWNTGPCHTYHGPKNETGPLRLLSFRFQRYKVPRLSEGWPELTSHDFHESMTTTGSCFLIQPTDKPRAYTPMRVSTALVVFTLKRRKAGK